MRIRVKIILKYGDKWMAESLYRACLQEYVMDKKAGVKATIGDGNLLLLFKVNKPSKIAERIRHVLNLLHMAERAAKLVRA